MDAKSTWMPKGITKSNSNASAGGRSTKSYDSVKVIGGHAFGTLRCLHPENSPRTSAAGDDDDDGPPPLELSSAPSAPPSQRPARRSKPPRDPMMHSMGGGDVLVVLHLPEAYTVGYDAVSYTARSFAGLRDLPAGPHFIWAAHPEASTTRCGFWVMGSNGSANRVHVTQWHPYNEVFVQPTRTEARIQAENVDKIFHKLPPCRNNAALGVTRGDLHPFKAEASVHLWGQLTNYISIKVLDRITSDQEDGWNVHSCDRVKGSIILPSELELDRRLSHSVFQSHELKFCFEQQNKTYAVSSVGRDRTLDATDATSYVLSWMADTPARRHLTETDILGDFQFAYVVAVYLGNDACMEQWWYMVLRIFLRAHRLIIRRAGFVAAVLRTLAAQLSHSINWVESSILDYTIHNKRDLRTSLIIYKRRMKEFVKVTTPQDMAAVTEAFAKVEAAVAELGWDLHTDILRRGRLKLEDGEIDLKMEVFEAEDERGEYAPEILEFDEHGRQIGLVSWSD